MSARAAKALELRKRGQEPEKQGSHGSDAEKATFRKMGLASRELGEAMGLVDGLSGHTAADA
jgi:hypothetical protein